MSSGMFEGIPDRPDGGEGYEPGVVGFGSNLVERVAGLYIGGTLSGQHEGETRECYAACAGLIGEHLDDAAPGAFNHNLFLDAVFRHAASRIHETDYWTAANSNWLVTPLVQALYDRGFNGFALAVPEAIMPRNPLCWLRGTPETPLKIACLGNGKSNYKTPYIASHVEHCHITAVGIAASDVGREAVSSVITADCASLYGSDARSCEFHILSQGFTFPDYAALCSFFAHGAAAEPTLPPRIAETFFWYGNRLLYPDARGGWQEVPE